MITKEQLLEAGYREHYHREEYTRNVMYQKAVYSADKSKRAYFVNAYIWFFPQAGLNGTVSFDVRLYWPEDNTLVGSAGFDLKLSASDAAEISKVESFFLNAYHVFGCVPDLHNND